MSMFIPDLSAFSIVMVGTTLPANIGSAARAMHTMRLDKLTIVNPKLPIDHTSQANAAGGAGVLDTAIIASDLGLALAPYQLIFAASARHRHLPRPVLTPMQAAVLSDNFLQKQPNASIAIIFGREDRGLTNDELALADYHIQIPANPDYPVLNVASAIQVIAATLYAHFYHKHDITHHKNTLSITLRSEWDEPAITLDQRHALEHNFIKLLTKLNLARDHELKDLPNRLSRLTSRLQLDTKEYALLQSLIAKLDKLVP